MASQSHVDARLKSMERAISALNDATNAAVARGIPMARLTWVEKQIWKMALEVGALNSSPSQAGKSALPALKSTTSAPVLSKANQKQEAVASAYGGRTRSRTTAPAQSALPVADQSKGSPSLTSPRKTGEKHGTIASVYGGRGRSRIPPGSDQGARSPTRVAAPTFSAEPKLSTEPKEPEPVGASSSNDGTVAKLNKPRTPWRRRHYRIHMDEPIRLDEVAYGHVARPTPTRARTAVDQANKGFDDVHVRRMAHLIGALRDQAQGSGGEVDRATFYAALVQHGVLVSDTDAAMSDAPDKLFETIDKDNSGRISMEELEEALLSLLEDSKSSSAVHELLSAGNNVMKQAVLKMNSSLRAGIERVVAVFKDWDINEDGCISRDEFRAALPLIGITGYLPEEVDALFDSFDPDGSGELTYRELFQTLRYNPDLHGSKKPKAKKRVVESEPVADMKQLLLRTRLEFFQMEVEQEVLNWTRSRGGSSGAANPTISPGLFAGLVKRDA